MRKFLKTEMWFLVCVCVCVCVSMLVVSCSVYLIWLCFSLFQLFFPICGVISLKKSSLTCIMISYFLHSRRVNKLSLFYSLHACENQ